MINFIQKNHKAQTMLEFTALITIVIGALIMVQVYFKRGIQGRWKASTDELSEELYDPFLSDSNVLYRTASNAVVEITTIRDNTGFWTIREDQTNSLDTRSGSTLIGGYQ
ncbi:MAG: hypothetical protein AB1650_04100 [Candidatus Omnitrophota bacterium]